MPTWRSAAVFHSRAAVTGKAWSPMVERRVRRTTSDYVDAERRRWRASPADDWWSSSARYDGAVWCRHLYTRTASLNLMRSGTFSQCNCVSGVMRSYNKPSSKTQHQLHLLAFGYLSKQNYGKSLQDNSPTNQLVVSQVEDWITRGLVNSPTANF